MAPRFVATINGHKPTTHQQQQRRTIITIILRNTINSQATSSLTMEIPSVTILVAAPCLRHMDACKKAYLLPSKRPRWWMKCTIKAVRVNWIQSIIRSEATQGDVLIRWNSFVCFCRSRKLFFQCSINLSNQIFHLIPQMWYVQPSTPTPARICGTQRRYELEKSKRSRRTCSPQRRCSLELQSHSRGQLSS